MIDKLRSRGPVDVQADWKRSPGILNLILTLTGLFVLATLGGAAAIAVFGPPWAMTFELKHFLILGLGIGSVVTVFGALAFLATRADY